MWLLTTPSSYIKTYTEIKRWLRFSYYFSASAVNTFKSLWMMGGFWECMWATAEQVSKNTLSTCRGVRRTVRTMSSMRPPKRGERVEEGGEGREVWGKGREGRGGGEKRGKWERKEEETRREEGEGKGEDRKGGGTKGIKRDAGRKGGESTSSSLTFHTYRSHTSQHR